MSLEGNVEGTNEIKGRIYTLPQADETLTKEGFAADAKATGDKFKELEERFDNIDPHDAENVGYDNSESGLEAENMQSAIDELAENSLSKKSGGMVKGPVRVQNAENGYGEVSKNNSDTADYGTQMVDVSKDGKSAKVAISAANDTFVYTDRDGNIRNVFHEGTKPFGNYTGNGSATARAIDTKGIGRMLLVYCSTHQAYVTPKGADVIDLTTGERTWLESTKVHYLSGKLNLVTAHDAFNKANETYYCQSI